MSWPAGAALRHRALRRQRRRRLAGGVAAAVLVAAGMTAVLTNDGPPPTYPTAAVRTAATLPGAVQLVANVRPLAGSAADASAVARANQAFTTNLLHHLPAGEDNPTVSPWSLYVALGMLANGATGATADGLRRVLGLVPSTGLNGGIAAETRSLESAGSVTSANSVWTQPGFTPEAPFLTALAQSFQAGTWQTDFQRPEAVTAINNWVNQQTHGAITELFDHFDPDTVLVLANALYLHDTWQIPFDPANTAPGPFTTPSGRTSQALFMTRYGQGYLSGHGYEGFRFPYARGGLTATAVLPTSSDLNTFVRDLTPDHLHAMLAGPTQVGYVDLPRFSTTSNEHDLRIVLSDMGVTSWDGLDGIGPDLTVGQVVQRTALTVGEEGTTAAAATGLGINAVSAPPNEVYFNRPFLFLITDAAGAVLFASQVNDPSR